MTDIVGLTTKSILFIALSLSCLPLLEAKVAIPVSTTATTAKKPTEPPLKKGMWITVLKLNRAKRLLEIQIDNATDIGPNLARPDALAEAVGIVDPSERKAFVDDPVRFVGSKFVLEKDLPLVSPY